MIRQEIGKIIKDSLGNLIKAKKISKDFVDFGFDFEIPQKEFGDYTTKIYKVTKREVKHYPIEGVIHEEVENFPKRDSETIAEEIKTHPDFKKFFEKIEFKIPVFFNFSFSKDYLQKQVGEILKQKEKFGALKIGKGKKVNVEFISANPTGPLHLGHGRGAFFGDTLANILNNAGFKTVREYYINDAKNSNQIKELGKTALERGTVYLNEYLRKKIQNLKSKIKKCKNEGETGYLLAREVHKDIKNFIEKNLRIKFDNWISEENFYRESKIAKIYNWLKKRKLIYLKEKADWLKTSKYGDIKDWVIVRKTGEPTYLLSDIAYHKDKFDRGFDKVINIWGADHQGHVGKIKAVAKILSYKGDLDILISQVVRLKKGKISKRRGEIVTLEWLLDEVGLDAARFFYLIKSLDTQMEFDIELAKEKSQKSPVYYVQYAHARICSILKKAPKYNIRNTKYDLINHPNELELIKQLIRLPEIIEDTVKDYQVQRLPQYAMDLATVFHQFYRDCRVISDNKELTQTRLALVLATKIALKNTLNLMGISAPEKM